MISLLQEKWMHYRGFMQVEALIVLQTRRRIITNHWCKVDDLSSVIDHMPMIGSLWCDDVVVGWQVRAK